MSSSTLGHYLRFDPEEVTEDEAMHTAIVKHGIVGNCNHIADQVAQVRCKWVAYTSTHYYEPEVLSVASPPTLGTTATDYYRLWRSTPFDLHLAEDGQSYSLRCRLRGARSAGAGTCTFRVVVAAQDRGSLYVFDTNNSNVSYVDVSSATHAWYDLNADVLVLDAGMVELARATCPIRDAVGGTVNGGPWLRATVEVWARTTSTASVPRVSGLVVEEFYA